MNEGIEFINIFGIQGYECGQIIRYLLEEVFSNPINALFKQLTPLTRRVRTLCNNPNNQ